MQQHAPWYLFWNSLSDDEKILFRLLQQTYSELGSNVKMFYFGYIDKKAQIRNYVLGRFGVDLENLPIDRNTTT